MKGLSVWGLCFWIFVAIKLAGSSLASWSWLWVIMPMVPLLALLVRHLGL